MSFEGSGIPDDDIENYAEYAAVIDSVKCCICLDVVKNPVECSGCESLYCEECWNMWRTKGNKCANRCSNDVVKANSFVFQILEKLRIRCNNCGKGGISYSKYLLHNDRCILGNKLGKLEELRNIINERNQKLMQLQKELEDLKNNNETAKSYVIVERLSKEQLRQKFVTFSLSVQQKMDLYQATIEGRLKEFRRLVEEKHFPMLEEVSAHNYFWTPLHYAMHYGKWDIIEYILDAKNKEGQLENVMRLQSNDNRCPLMCLIKSNALGIEDKKKILEKCLTRYKFEISPEVMRELRNRNMEGIVKQFKR